MKPDYLIIGSGLSALTFGALMANSGKTVQILEAHEHPGGFGHTFTMAKKYTFNAQFHYVWNCGEGQTVNQVLKKLGLDKEVTFERYDPDGFDHMRMPGYALDIPSEPEELIDDFPAELAIPMLRDYLAVNWVRVKGGVYSYIEKILERFKGEVLLNVEIDRISRSSDAVRIVRSTGEIQEFDKVVFATPPDQVMALLADPTDAETKRFSAWKANHATTLVHRDISMYARHGITQPSEFDFFQKADSRWGYNGCLNQLCGISSPQHNFLSFQLEELITPDRIIHRQEHHTPLYTTESFRYRDEVVATNGENNTYHAGAYLGDGLHEGAIASAFRVAQLIEQTKLKTVLLQPSS